LLHRYQVEAASKLVGGMDYTFACASDGQTAHAELLRLRNSGGAGGGVGNTEAGGLALPRPCEMIPPRPGIRARRGDFKIRTSPAFDARAPAEAAAQHTLQFCQSAAGGTGWSVSCAESRNPSLEEVLDTVTRSREDSHVTGYWWEISRSLTRVYTTDALRPTSAVLGGSCVTWLKLGQWKDWLESTVPNIRGNEAEQAI